MISHTSSSSAESGEDIAAAAMAKETSYSPFSVVFEMLAAARMKP
jgi:hypothetical protein